jgi:mono/diheme cytochrome c family protein
MKRLFLFALAVASASASVSCDSHENVHEPEWTLSRMLEQPRYEPYGQSTFFDDGRAMRKPVEGAISREAVLGAPLFVDGIDDGHYAEHFPLTVSKELLEQGRLGFEVVCATCHGVLGDGDSPVAAKMQLRKPPSLLTDDIAGFPPGRVYRVITVGYGLMPANDYQLNAEERWAVVAYVKALERSQTAKVSELPPEVRAELERQAP